MSFDTLAYVHALEAKGVTRAQAEAHAEALSTALAGELATRTDMVRIEERLALCSTRADLAALDTRVARIEERLGLCATRADLAETKTDLTRYILGGAGLISLALLVTKWLIP